jgi:hypothetical protein
MKTKTIKVEDCLEVIAFFSQKELVKKPRMRKDVAVMNNAIVASVSPNMKEATMGSSMKTPETCRTNPMLASKTVMVFVI